MSHGADRKAEMAATAALTQSRVKEQPAAAPKGAFVLIGLLGASLVFTRVTALGPIQGNLSLADLFVLPALVTLSPLLRGRWSFYYWLLALLLVNVASWVNGFEFTTTQTLVDFVKLLVTFGYGLVGLGIGRLPGGERAFAKGVLLTLVPVALVMVVASVTGNPRWFLEPGLIRVRGPMTDANGMCIYLAGVLPLVAGLWPGWLVLILAGALTTASRTGIVATTLAFVTWCLTQRRVALLVVVLAVGSVVVALLMQTAPVQRVLRYERTLSTRTIVWEVGWRKATEHPFLGVGKGNYVVTKVRDVPDPHNTYLELLVGNGVAGLVVFLVPVAWWLLQPVAAGGIDNWWVTVVACLVAGLAVSLMDWRLFWLALGALHGGRLARQEVGAKR